jgi:DNA processing protein
MNITDNALNVLAAKTYRGIGRAWIVKNIKGNESTDRLVMLLNQGTKEGYSIPNCEFEGRKQNIRNQLEQSVGVADGVIALRDPDFPSCRGEVKNSEKPVVLFYRGNLRLLEEENKNIAIIGLLNPDEDTEVFEKRVVTNLVNHGVTIVSGLALGCDSIAHKQAILSGGKTVAILPSPITDILPQGNKGLAEAIVEHDGLLVSEYYERANSKMGLSGRYLERDRLQALFSDCIILSASYAENNLGNDSGSRHAMKYALSYSIPRAIMYDHTVNVGNPKYDLNRQLVREDSRIIIINRNNFQETLKKILSGHAKSAIDSAIQTSLF